jgi:hypothetical protein
MHTVMFSYAHSIISLTHSLLHTDSVPELESEHTESSWTDFEFDCDDDKDAHIALTKDEDKVDDDNDDEDAIVSFQLQDPTAFLWYLARFIVSLVYIVVHKTQPKKRGDGPGPGTETLSTPL